MFSSRRRSEEGGAVQEVLQPVVVEPGRVVVINEVGQHRREDILGRVGEKGLVGLLDLLLEKGVGDLDDVFLHVIVPLNLVVDIPVVRPVRPGGGAVVADHHIPGAVEGAVKIPLGVKDDDHILGGQVVQQLSQQLVDGVGLAGADAAQQHDVTAEQVFVQVYVFSFADAVPLQPALHRPHRVGHRLVPQGAAVKDFDAFHQFHGGFLLMGQRWMLPSRLWSLPPESRPLPGS